jgi:hypothetical protein
MSAESLRAGAGFRVGDGRELDNGSPGKTVRSPQHPSSMAAEPPALICRTSGYGDAHVPGGRLQRGARQDKDRLGDIAGLAATVWP